MENGVHEISNDAYHGSKGVSRSQLWALRKSPYHYWYEYLNKPYEPKVMTPALLTGDVLHTLILEPHLFDERYAVAPDVDRRYKAGKIEYQAFLESSGDKTIITHDQHVIAARMAHSLEQNEYVKPLLQGCVIERSIYFTHEPTGMQCKVRPDAWNNQLVVDLKTTADASYRAFQNSAYKYGYYLQAAMINQALKSLDIEMQKFVFLCVENTEPYATAVYILDREAIDYGVALLDELMASLAEHLTTDSWPAYDVQVLHLPNYANYD